jgi:hypothetical protein
MKDGLEAWLPFSAFCLFGLAEKLVMNPVL